MGNMVDIINYTKEQAHTGAGSNVFVEALSDHEISKALKRQHIAGQLYFFIAKINY